MDFGIAGVAAITVIAYMVGCGVRASRLDHKWIPVLCGVTGGILGVVSLFIMPEFPAGDVINALAVGIVSGLAATGVDQVMRQMGGKEERHG